MMLIMTMTMTMTMKISLFDINHLITMIRENKAEKNNVVNEQETIQNNIECRYRRPTPISVILLIICYNCFLFTTINLCTNSVISN